MLRFLILIFTYLLQQIIHPDGNRSGFVPFAGIVRTAVTVFFGRIFTSNLENTHIGFFQKIKEVLPYNILNYYNK
jgi:hypothetical protein